MSLAYAAMSATSSLSSRAQSAPTSNATNQHHATTANTTIGAMYTKKVNQTSAAFASPSVPFATSSFTEATASARSSPPPASHHAIAVDSTSSTTASPHSAVIANAATTYTRSFAGVNNNHNHSASFSATSAFKVQPELDPLERERREIERRRERFEDRRKRVLHAKTRVIGVDVDGIASQIKERQERERLEAERNQYYDDVTASHAKQLTALEQMRQKAEAERTRELAFFRQQQTMEKQIKSSIERAAINNVNDMDTMLLKFAGEDLEYKDRVKAQQLQQQDWCAQQIYERADREAKERQAEAEYAAYQDRITAAQMENEAARLRAAAVRNASTTAFNAHQMSERRARESRDRAVSSALDETELLSTFYSPLLTEDNSKDGNRGYMFKGFSVEQRQAVLDEQARQVEEARLRRSRDRNEEKEYADEMERVRRMGVRMEMQKQRREAEQRLAVRDERLWQARQKHVRDAYLTNVVYTNPVREEYFDQFGTSCR